MPPTSRLSCPMARLQRWSRQRTALSCIRRQRKAPLHWLPKKGSAKSNELTFQVIDKEKAEQERIAAEKKAEEERIAAEKKAEEERLAAESGAGTYCRTAAESGTVPELRYGLRHPDRQEISL